MSTVSASRTTSTLQELLAGLPDSDVIPMPLIRDRVGWTRTAQADAVREGLIKPLPVHGPAGSFLVTRDDAVTIMVAAALAFIAGCAVIAMLRAIQGAGLDAQALARAMT